MPFIKVYIHCVWSTKNREDLLDTKELRLKVWQHIKENAIKKDIFIDHISGYSNHCHCLISLSSNQSIQNIMQLIKGESSYWINKNNLTENRFEWQDEYFAVSVSESMIDKIREYIRKQEQHHAENTYEEEIQKFMIKYKIPPKAGGNLTIKTNTK